MTSALPLAAYFTMLLLPCVVAEWGDVLTFRWISAVRRRRGTHPQETWLESFREERYSLSLAAEADFLHRNQRVDTPTPFIVFKHLEPVQTPAFLAARQRVAARMAQIVVAQKLRADAADAEQVEQAEQENVIALPADVPVNEVSAILASAEAALPHFKDYVAALYPEPLWEFAPPQMAYTPPAYSFQELTVPITLATGPPRHASAEVIPITGRRTYIEPHPPRPPGGKPFENPDASSDEVVIAA